ncbi:MAG: hypothetical protein VKL39_05475 [Leptolyngbyaceae bacterium]|nr:hypothetical protein [Leptolyngbyaceae bacterium]
MNNGKPNLAITISLYTGGILFVIFAILLLLQATGIVSTVPTTVYVALVFLAIGCGLLYGVASRN